MFSLFPVAIQMKISVWQQNSYNQISMLCYDTVLQLLLSGVGALFLADADLISN